MANAHSLDELLGFLDHAADKGLMPAATATALGVATRNVVAVLDTAEREDVRQLDLDAVIRRFQNKRARDFSGDTLKEYGRRFRRAIELFTGWRDDPANFRVKTRATAPQRKRKNGGAASDVAAAAIPRSADLETPQTVTGSSLPPVAGTYQTVVPLGRERFVILQVPADLTRAEADRLASFVKFLPAED